MPHTLTCAHCNKEFIDIHRCKQKFCSRECYFDSIRKSVTILCKQCHKPFSVYPHDQNKRKYCSYACNNKSRIKYPDPKERVCLGCDGAFTPSDKRGAKFCSVKCRYGHLRQKKTWKCPVCNSAFESTRNQMCCSFECGTKYRNQKTDVEKVCPTCDKVFMGKKYKRNQKYCSVRCAAFGTAMKGSKNPNWKGGRAKNKYYGLNWKQQKSKARERDDYTCQKCRIHRKHPTLSVHHIIPFRKFGDYKAANQLENLITLCQPCHIRMEHGKI